MYDLSLIVAVQNKEVTNLLLVAVRNEAQRRSVCASSKPSAFKEKVLLRIRPKFVTAGL